MRSLRAIPRAALVGTAISVAFVGAAFARSDDAGLAHEHELADEAEDFFGVKAPVAASSTIDMTAADIEANPAGLMTVAKGLKVRVVSAGNASPNIDMMVPWPSANPTHLIACNEEDPAQPGVQKIDLATGMATTIVTGTAGCDPVETTPWGTVVFGEEVGGTGELFEIIDPLNVAGATIDRATGVSSSPNIRRIDALGFVAFEGIGILPNGVTYYGDERSASNGGPGGSYYKFVPSTPWAGGAAITSLDQSPLASGTVFGLRVGQGANFGQGFSTGIGSWRSLTSTPAQNLNTLAVAAKTTGYYRPEDLDLDTTSVANGIVRMCGNNTGRDSARYWGETICISDGPVAASASGASVPEVQLLVEGSTDFNMPDNIVFQASRGNWIIHEDGSTSGHPDGARNNDIWSCLDDKADADTMSDGCIRIATINDFDAETTGGVFDSTGKHFYVSIQHNSSGFGTILDITGWR
jgi:hypothetical protein